MEQSHWVVLFLHWVRRFYFKCIRCVYCLLMQVCLWNGIMFNRHQPRHILHKLIRLIFWHLLRLLLNFKLGPQMRLFVFNFMIQFSPFIFVAVTLDQGLLCVVKDCRLDKGGCDVFLVWWVVFFFGRLIVTVDVALVHLNSLFLYWKIIINLKINIFQGLWMSFILGFLSFFSTQKMQQFFIN